MSAAADLAARVQAALDKIRPAIQADGGDIELVEVIGNSAKVRLHGACVGCPSAQATLWMGVEHFLREEVPGFERLIEEGMEGSLGLHRMRS